MSTRYAEGTNVSVDKTQNEIRTLLSKHGVKHREGKMPPLMLGDGR